MIVHRIFRLLFCMALSLPPASAAGAATVPIVPASKPALETTLDSTGLAHYREALKAADKRQWQQALSIADAAGMPLLAKVVRWDFFRQRGRTGSFQEIAGFMADNPDWPGQHLLQRRAEEAIDDTVTDSVLMDWYSERRPVTGPAMIALAEAMMRNGMTEGGVQWLRYAWVHETFTRTQSRDIFRRHKKHLTSEDHIKRLDRLLWNGHRASARGMLSLVPRAQRLLAEARIALMSRSAGVDARIAAVPAELRNDPGLIYERARWRRRAGLDSGVRELLVTAPDRVGPRPERWWIERRIAARQAMSDNDYDSAYRIAAAHGQSPGGVEFAEGEWLAGWIALRFLNRGEQALAHFETLYGNVRYPVSQARAAYWAGRASEHARDAENTARWYGIAARLPSTYYGQLAHVAIRPGVELQLPGDPIPGPDDRAAFEKRELVRVLRALIQLNDKHRARQFLLQLSDQARSDVEHVQVATLAQEAGLPNLSVRAAKGAMRDGHELFEQGYPVLTVRAQGVEPALVHAVARQESEFDPQAVSRADARGLMQLLPSTAKEVAHGKKLRYSKARLFDPDFNVTLGSAYLSELLDTFDGSYILALAAYNAGPSRAKRWVREHGVPGRDGIDPIDWVEMIPISETRNYVQRVLENLQIYRARLAAAPVGIALVQDLHRGSQHTASAQ